jgi:hypothetical protein
MNAAPLIECEAPNRIATKSPVRPIKGFLPEASISETKRVFPMAAVQIFSKTPGPRLKEILESRPPPHWGINE